VLSCCLAAQERRGALRAHRAALPFVGGALPFIESALPLVVAGFRRGTAKEQFFFEFVKSVCHHFQKKAVPLQCQKQAI